MTRKQDDNDHGRKISPAQGNRQSPGQPRDIHEAQLESLLAQLIDAAEDCFAEARKLGHDRDTQVEIFQQAAALSKAYGQLLIVRNRHRRMLKEED